MVRQAHHERSLRLTMSGKQPAHPEPVEGWFDKLTMSGL